MRHKISTLTLFSKKKQQAGRSMVEMLGVLAIVGVLSVMGIYGYRMAMIKYRANEIMSEALKRAMIVSSQIAVGDEGNQDVDNADIFWYDVPLFEDQVYSAQFLYGVAHDKRKKQLIVELTAPEEICRHIKGMAGDDDANFMYVEGDCTKAAISPEDDESGTGGFAIVFGDDLDTLKSDSEDDITTGGSISCSSKSDCDITQCEDCVKNVCEKRCEGECNNGLCPEAEGYTYEDKECQTDNDCDPDNCIVCWNEKLTPGHADNKCHSCPSVDGYGCYHKVGGNVGQKECRTDGGNPICEVNSYTYYDPNGQAVETTLCCPSSFSCPENLICNESTHKCEICQKGYYWNDGKCSQCPTESAGWKNKSNMPINATACECATTQDCGECGRCVANSCVNGCSGSGVCTPVDGQYFCHYDDTDENYCPDGRLPCYGTCCASDKVCDESYQGCFGIGSGECHTNENCTQHATEPNSPLSYCTDGACFCSGNSCQPKGTLQEIPYCTNLDDCNHNRFKYVYLSSGNKVSWDDAQNLCAAHGKRMFNLNNINANSSTDRSCEKNTLGAYRFTCPFAFKEDLRKCFWTTLKTGIFCTYFNSEENKYYEWFASGSGQYPDGYSSASGQPQAYVLCQ